MELLALILAAGACYAAYRSNRKARIKAQQADQEFGAKMDYVGLRLRATTAGNQIEVVSAGAMREQRAIGVIVRNNLPDLHQMGPEYMQQTGLRMGGIAVNAALMLPEFDQAMCEGWRVFLRAEDCNGQPIHECILNRRDLLTYAAAYAHTT